MCMWNEFVKTQFLLQTECTQVKPALISLLGYKSPGLHRKGAGKKKGSFPLALEGNPPRSELRQAGRDCRQAVCADAVSAVPFLRLRGGLQFAVLLVLI